MASITVKQYHAKDKYPVPPKWAEDFGNKCKGDQCWICGKHSNDLVQDHDGESGYFRGWVCEHLCGLDRTANIQRMVNYVVHLGVPFQKQYEQIHGVDVE
jgi:hypothetical protein